MSRIVKVYPISEPPVLERPVKRKVVNPDSSVSEVDEIERYGNPKYHLNHAAATDPKTGEVAQRYDFGRYHVDTFGGPPTIEELEHHLKDHPAKVL